MALPDAPAEMIHARKPERRMAEQSRAAADVPGLVGRGSRSQRESHRRHLGGVAGCGRSSGPRRHQRCASGPIEGHDRSSRRVTLVAAAIGLLVGLAVVAPWMRGGYLLLLDWVSGPNQTLTPGVYGLSGSALDAMPFRIMTQVLREAVGPAATAWIVILAYFPLAAAGASVAAGGSAWRRLGAALFMVCNPWSSIAYGWDTLPFCLAWRPASLAFRCST